MLALQNVNLEKGWAGLSGHQMPPSECYKLTEMGDSQNRWDSFKWTLLINKILNLTLWGSKLVHKQYNTKHMGLCQNPVQWFCLPEPNPSSSLLHQVKLMMVLSITLISVFLYIRIKYIVSKWTPLAFRWLRFVFSFFFSELPFFPPLKASLKWFFTHKMHIVKRPTYWLHNYLVPFSIRDRDGEHKLNERRQQGFYCTVININRP